MDSSSRQIGSSVTLTFSYWPWSAGWRIGVPLGGRTVTRLSVMIGKSWKTRHGDAEQELPQGVLEAALVLLGPVGGQEVVEVQAQGRMAVGAGVSSAGNLLVLERGVLLDAVQEQVDARDSAASGWFWVSERGKPSVTRISVSPSGNSIRSSRRVRSMALTAPIAWKSLMILGISRGSALTASERLVPVSVIANGLVGFEPLRGRPAPAPAGP